MRRFGTRPTMDQKREKEGNYDQRRDDVPRAQAQIEDEASSWERIQRYGDGEGQASTDDHGNAEALNGRPDVHEIAVWVATLCSDDRMSPKAGPGYLGDVMNMWHESTVRQDRAHLPCDHQKRGWPNCGERLSRS